MQRRSPLIFVNLQLDVWRDIDCPVIMTGGIQRRVWTSMTPWTIFRNFSDVWYSRLVNLLTNSESRSEDFEIQKSKSMGCCMLQRIQTIVWLVALFILLGVWSLLHQVSYAPPLAGARPAVIRKIHALQIISLDEEIVPKEGSAAGWILGDGFAQAEGDGVWMTALNASINFSIDSWTKVPRSMTLTFVPLLGPTRPRRVLTVSSAGASVTKTIVGTDSVIIALNGDLQQSINISCDSVDSANSLRVGPDFRPMCVKLISLVVKST